MDKNKLMQQIIGEMVKDHGFEFERHIGDIHAEEYVYRREKGEVCQFIVIDVSEMGLRLELGTDAYGWEDYWFMATGMIECPFTIEEGDFIQFETEEKFKEILYYFRKVLLEKGFEYLEEMSIPVTEVRPKKWTFQKLYIEHEALNREYRKKYDLEEMESSRELVQRISDIILATADREFSEVEEMLVGLAAVYGDEILRKCGGEYEWIEDCSMCILCTERGSFCPLVSMISYWGEKREDVNQLLIGWG